jgi:acetyl-CoA C-acetyltransferase
VGNEVYIVSAKRTPLGAFQGALSGLSAPAIGAAAIKAATADVDVTKLDEVIMGCVLPAGVGQAPARQAAKAAGIPDGVGALTINKVCGSGLKAVMLARTAILAGEANLVLAGGMECMSQAPYYLPKARDGYRMGHGQLVDGMIHDGLWDPYGNFHMGNAGEKCAQKYTFTREAQDAFAVESTRRAQQAIADGAFADEITPVTIPQRKGDPVTVETDEQPGRAKPDKLPKLRPAFDKEGTITAGNASSINDGGAAMLVASQQAVTEHGLTPLAKITAVATHSQAPEWFTTAPVGAIEKALAKAGLTVDDIDLFEINEAFAVVAMAAMEELSIPHEKVNVHGGAVALGHPIGASGARILVTLIHALKRNGKQRGLATLCIGGGEAVAVIIELV